MAQHTLNVFLGARYNRTVGPARPMQARRPSASQIDDRGASGSAWLQVLEQHTHEVEA